MLSLSYIIFLKFLSMRGIKADIRGDELGDEIAFFHQFLYNSKKYGHKKTLYFRGFNSF